MPTVMNAIKQIKIKIKQESWVKSPIISISPSTNSQRDTKTAMNSGNGIPAWIMVSNIICWFFSTKSLLYPVVKKNRPTDILIKATEKLLNCGE